MLSALLLSPTGLLFAARPPRLPITTMLAADRGGDYATMQSLLRTMRFVRE